MYEKRIFNIVTRDSSLNTGEENVSKRMKVTEGFEFAMDAVMNVFSLFLVNDSIMREAYTCLQSHMALHLRKINECELTREFMAVASLSISNDFPAFKYKNGSTDLQEVMSHLEK